MTALMYAVQHRASLNLIKLLVVEHKANLFLTDAVSYDKNDSILIQTTMPKA